MILEFFYIIISALLTIITALLPDYNTMPLPTWFSTNFVLLAKTMKLIVELPVIRVLYEYALIWFTLWLIIWGYNLATKIAGITPWTKGLSKFSIKDDDEKK